MLSRKHFKWFAQFVGDHELSREAMQDLMDYFSEENPKFDEVKWVEATKKYGRNDQWQGLV